MVPDATPKNPCLVTSLLSLARLEVKSKWSSNNRLLMLDFIVYLSSLAHCFLQAIA